MITNIYECFGKYSKNINLQQKPFDTGMYRICTQNISKYLFMVQYIRNVFNFYGKYSKAFVFVPKTVENYLFLTWNIWKIPNFKTKHLKWFWFLRKTFQIYLVSFQNIWKISSCHPKKIERYFIYVWNIQNVSKFYFWLGHFCPKDSRDFQFLRETFDKSCIL